MGGAVPSEGGTAGLGNTLSGVGSVFTTVETDRAFPAARGVLRGRASGTREPLEPAAFFPDGVPCGAIVGVAAGVPFAGLKTVDDDFLVAMGVWLTVGDVLVDFVGADTVTCLTVTLLLLVAGLEVLTEADGFEDVAFVAGNAFADFAVAARPVEDDALVFVVEVVVLDEVVLAEVAIFFFAEYFLLSGSSSSSSLLSSLSLTSSSLLGSGRLRLAPVFAPFMDALPLGIAVAGTSQWPRSRVLIFLLRKVSIVFVTLVFARMSTWTLRTSARIAQIALESCIKDIVDLCL